MKVFYSLDEINIKEKTSVALGNFDGVHKGHQALISQAVETAKARGIKSAVFTFTNHPSNVIAGKTVVNNIMAPWEKAEAIEKYGVDYLFSVDFDDMMRTSSPGEFCRKIIKDKLNAAHCVCGFNYTFAYKAQGDPKVLKLFGTEYGYDVTEVDPVYVGRDIVSSTLIRAAIANGRVDSYISYTGRPYDIEGIVIHGKHLGSRIGFPTVNLSLDGSMTQPLNGVYITKTYVNNKIYPSITNVGNKPTVGYFDKNAETHIFGFNGDLYGKIVKVEFIKLLRAEFKFASIDELQEQIHRDCVYAQQYHMTHTEEIK